jgi:3-phenylpropionate/trans-cinnamate dioxygenase ferredoxin reductase component
VIVGASLAGLRAGEALRRQGYRGELFLVGRERHPPYDRPPLSKDVLLGTAALEDVSLTPCAGLGAEWVLGDPAVALELDRRIVHTQTGRALRFDGLVVATGSEARWLPGIDPNMAGIMKLRTLDDALAVRDRLEPGAHLVIAGAGFVGVEVASAAISRGARVTIVSPGPPMARAGELVSDACRALLTRHGVELWLGRRVSWAAGKGRLERVVLDDGATIEADSLLVAIGARPCTDWLRGSGLPLDDGLECDRSLAAVGADRVVAAGDVVRWPNSLFGESRMRVEHWSNAVEQAAAAAATLLHGSAAKTKFATVPSFWSDHFGTRLQVVGLPAVADRTEVVAGCAAEGEFTAVFWRDDELVGAASYGMPAALVPYRLRVGQHERNPPSRHGENGKPRVIVACRESAAAPWRSS